MLTDHAAGYQPSIADDLIAEPYAVGHCLVVRPDDDLSRLTIESSGALLKLYDGRMNHNNGWFVVSSEVPEGVTENAIRWTIRPNAADGWIGKPTVQTSQVGYHPAQPKTALIELDPNDTARPDIQLLKLTESGMQPVKTLKRKPWGRFLRYEYLQADFTGVTEPGMYQIRFGEALSPLFRIGEDVYDRGVWQPVLEYFLPVQMCHMRVNEKYRVWHGLCHNDDARMAPVNHTHFDGYYQGPSTLTAYQPGEHVPGLNVGGWHDAGDYDLRVESQAGECYILTMAYEAFHVQYDATTIDQQRKVVEIHEPDGKNDILQQIEHGLLSVVGAYRALGRLYRGIIGSHLRQYVLLGDGSTMTDSAEILKALVDGKAALAPLGGTGEDTAGYKGYGYAAVVEILSAALAGGKFMKALSGVDESGNPRMYSLGHFFFVVDPNAFMGEDEFRAIAGQICRELRASEKAPGQERIYTAGEKEYLAWLDRKDKGVPVSESVQRELVAVRDELGLDYRFPFER